MKKVALWALLCLSLSAQAETIQVATGANFSDAAKLIAAEFEKETGNKVNLVFGTVTKIHAQIHNGATHDVLISSDDAVPTKLVQEGYAIAESQHPYAMGKLVLWSKDATLVKDSESLKSPALRNLANANPKMAVYGARADEVMQNLGVFEALKPKFRIGENITQAHMFVASGAAEMGFVAWSQVVAEDGVSLKEGSVWMIPQDLYKPIRQDVVVLKRAEQNKAALAFADYLLNSEYAKKVILRYGYELPTK